MIVSDNHQANLFYVYTYSQDSQFYFLHNSLHSVPIIAISCRHCQHRQVLNYRPRVEREGPQSICILPPKYISCRLDRRRWVIWGLLIGRIGRIGHMNCKTEWIRGTEGLLINNESGIVIIANKSSQKVRMNPVSITATMSCWKDETGDKRQRCNKMVMRVKHRSLTSFDVSMPLSPQKALRLT